MKRFKHFHLKAKAKMRKWEIESGIVREWERISVSERERERQTVAPEDAR